MKKNLLLLFAVLSSLLIFSGAFALELVDADADGTVDYTRLEGGMTAGLNSTSYIRTDIVELTNAEIKALRGTPKDLVAAPGAGKFIELLAVTLVLDYGTNALTESTDNLVVQYGSGTDATAAITSSGFITATADTIAKAVPVAIAGVAASSVANDELELFNTGDGEIAGNAALDTTMTVFVTYAVHTLGL